MAHTQISKVVPASVLFFSAIGLLGQTTVGLGIPYPQVIVAPGQVITLQMYGLTATVPLDSTGVPQALASQVPLPTSLAGFTATIQQGVDDVATLPIFSVRQQNLCDPAQQTPVCLLTLLTVQMPTDLPLPTFLGSQQAEQTYVSVSDANNDSWFIRVLLDPVKVHILTQCDAVLPGLTYNEPFLSPCNPLITHADGSLVRLLTGFDGPYDTPAQPGETLIMYAYGLGVTQPPVPAGTASPIPPAVALRHFSLIFDYDCGTIVTGTPVFVGLTPGQVGLYQVNFKVPQAVACTTLPSGSGPTSGGNLTLLSDAWVSSDTVLLYLGANGGVQ